MKRALILSVLAVVAVSVALIVVCSRTRSPSAAKTISVESLHSDLIGDPLPMAGPLFESAEFRAYLRSTAMLAISRHRRLISVSVGPDIISEAEILKLERDRGSWGITCATTGARGHFYVDSTTRGQKLLMVDGRRQTRTIFSTKPQESGGQSPNIHSLSLSHSGRLLAFMVSRTARCGDWRWQTVMVYDIDRGSLRTIWRGDVGGPEVLLDPYAWVQPLPWSANDKAVLVSTPSKAILSVDIGTGAARKVAKGYLPIGFIGPEVLLVLEQSIPWLGEFPTWTIRRHDLKAKTAEALLQIDGPYGLRGPLISPDGAYISFVAQVYPGRKPVKGIFQYTLFLRLKDLQHALINAQIVAWTARPGGTMPTSTTRGTASRRLGTTTMPPGGRLLYDKTEDD